MLWHKSACRPKCRPSKPITMVFSIGISLTAACILALSVNSGHSSAVISQSDLSEVGPTDSPPVLPTSDDKVLENNDTANGFQITSYAIVDFAKLGYELFKEKMYQALSMLDTFMQMKPVVLRITRTFTFGNNSDSINESTVANISDTDDILSDDTHAEQAQTDIFETNTESPVNDEETMHLNEVEDHQDFLKRHYNTDLSTPKRKSAENENSMSNDNNKEEKKSSEQGFFGKVASGVGNFFKRIWNWLF